MRMWTKGMQQGIKVWCPSPALKGAIYLLRGKDEAPGGDMVSSEILATHTDTGLGQPFQSWRVKLHHKL